MSSAIRTAYDTIQLLIADDEKRLVAGQILENRPLFNGTSVEQDITDELDYSHIASIVGNYRHSLRVYEARLEVAERLFQVWLEGHHERKRAAADLFRMLPEDEQNELMLAKLKDQP